MERFVNISSVTRNLESEILRFRGLEGSEARGA